MTFKALQNLITNTQAYTAVDASQLVLPASVIAMLDTQLAGGYYTAVAVTDGNNYEVMNILGVTAGAADVERGIDGTTAVPLAKGSAVRFVWTTAGIGDVAPGGGVTLVGAGATAVTGGPAYTVTSPFFTFTAGAGISIGGGPVNFTITNTQAAAVPTTVTGSGIANVTGGPVNYNVDVAGPAFVGAGGITISGVWPNITITNTAVPSTGTMTSVVAGAGIAVTGATPGINPTISLATVGPGAGVYGGITLNAYGQVTAFAASLITSITSSTSGVTIGGPTGGAITINIANADHGQRGLVAFAPSDATGSNDAGNDTQAVTPKGLNAVANALTTANTPATFGSTGNQNALSPSAYTNVLSTFPIPVPAVPAGKTVLIDLYVETYDPVNPLVLQKVGIAIFDSLGLKAGNSNLVASNLRNLKCLISGPFTAQSLIVQTTPLTGTQIIGSFYASISRNF